MQPAFRFLTRAFPAVHTAPFEDVGCRTKLKAGHDDWGVI
jgi:hypothetical protein